MGVKRYIANYDTTITNAYKSDLSTRATGSNMGEAESLEVFSIYAQAYTDTTTYQGDAKNRERARFLIQFPVTASTGLDGIVSIKTDRTNNVIPAAGSVNFFLNLYNSRHNETLPDNFTLEIKTLKQGWQEGFGMDMEEFLDHTYDVDGANWINATSGSGVTGVAASATDVLRADSWAYGDSFTVTVPTAAGGTNTQVTVIVKNGLSAAVGANEIHFNGDGTDEVRQDNLVLAINGSGTSSQCKYGSANTGGIVGLTASEGTGYKVTLTASTVGLQGNDIAVADVDPGTTFVVEGQLSSGKLSGGSRNWDSAGASTSDIDYHTGSDYTKTFTFTSGLEDMSVDITDIVEKWLASSNAFANYGLRVSLTQSQEESTSRSYYTKKFYARHSSYFFLRPNIEARWDDSKKDDTANFYASSSLAGDADNLNTIYLYNRVRGQLADIPALGAGAHTTSTKVHLKVYPALGGTAKTLPNITGDDVAAENDTTVTGSWVETGIYSAKFGFSGSESTIYPVWSTTADVELHSGSAITVKSQAVSNNNVETEYVTTVTNLKSSYTQDEVARLRLFIREKNWSPTIYTKATATLDSTIVSNAYWKLFRVKDDFVVFDYGTGSNNTKLSYDVSGSYFDFNMNMLECGYAYGLKFIYKINGNYHEQPETFKFRVD